MKESNSAHGKNFQKWLLKELGIYLIKEKIKGIVANFGVRHPGYSDPEQYYAPLVISLNDNEQWAIFTTTTCRTDRIKGQQWDAEHLKMFCPTIKRVCLIYPSDVTEDVKKTFVAQRGKYLNRWEYSCIDVIESAAELFAEIENL